MPYQSQFGIDWSKGRRAQIAPGQSAQSQTDAAPGGYTSQFGIDWARMGENGGQSAGMSPAPAQGYPKDVPAGDLQQFVGQPAPQRDVGIPERLIGAAEAGLSLGTGSIGGAAGSVGGALYGAGKELLSGQFGTPEAANRIEQASMRGANALTYQPRTQQGQEDIKAVGEALGPLQALGPINIPRAPMQTIMPHMRLPSRAAKAIQQPSNMAEKAVAKAIRKGGASAKRVIEELHVPDEEVVASAKRLGFEDYLQPDHVSSSQQVRDIFQLAKSAPGSALREEETGNLLRVAAGAEELVRKMGAADDLSDVVYKVGDRLEKVQARLERIAEGKYNKVSEAIPKETKVSTANLVDYLQGRIEEFGGRKERLPAPERRLLNDLEKAPVTYGYLDHIRKEIGAGLKNKGRFKDTPHGDRKQLYKHLLADQEAAAADHGQLLQYKMASRATLLSKSIDDDRSALFGKQLDKSFITPLKSAYRRIPQGDMRALEKILNSVPKDMRSQVAASGLASALGKFSKRGEVSFAEYSNWYKNASRNRRTFDRFLRYLPPGSERKLRDLYNVANGIYMAQKEYKPTGRGEMRLRSAIADVDGFMRTLFANAGKYSAAIGLESQAPGSGFMYAAKEVIRNLGRKEPRSALDNLLSSVQFRRVLNERVRTGGNSSKPAINGLANSRAFKDYIKAYGIETTPELWILSSLRQGQDNSEPQ